MPVSSAPPDDYAPVVSWEDFTGHVLRWDQDQHLGAVGPTGQGKSVAIHALVDHYRSYVVYLATKPKDKTLQAYIASGGYIRLYDWPPMAGFPKHEVTPQEMPRRLLWPDATRLHSEPEQKRVFGAALDDIYVDGGWCTVLDDFWYIANILGFERDTKKFLMNARSNDIPLVVGAQRPAGNRLVELFDQADHLLFFRDNDRNNLDRISGVGWLDGKVIREFVARLDQYQFLYVNTRKGWLFRSTAPPMKV